jgi:hypothetical protein
VIFEIEKVSSTRQEGIMEVTSAKRMGDAIFTLEVAFSMDHSVILSAWHSSEKMAL